MIRLIPLLLIALAAYLLIRRPRGREELRAWLVPIAVVLLSLLYIRSPIDLIPDSIGPIGLIDDLLAVIGALWWARQLRQQARTTSARPPGSTSDAASEGWDPYAVLGIPRGSSREQITRAYRERMKQYHPDRVDDLGDELKSVAHEKTLEIQRAYRELTAG
jgi:uncharacterized membrane protein YkvA (DUF1232 family)